ncbi:MAG: tripartite tricarboxylate transporter substrate binding protein [Betaproteobacteria bacterium]|nr:tripartite tricarboxylate transporter substrate binding protein [Betaproteobacteria bacterium]
MRSPAAIVAVVALAGAVTAATAQDYPRRTVRMVAPFAPGGATDVLARLVSQNLHERWGHSVIVDNRVGAGGHIGAELVSKAPPDGYTLLVAGTPHAIGVSLYQKLAYDLARDLVAANRIATYPSAIVVHPSLPVRTVKDLIALAKARPGELNFGSAGVGSPNGLAMELFKTMAKVSMVHIPYKGGSGQMVTELLAGQVQLASIGLPPAMPHVQAGKLRVIAVTGTKRSSLLPEAPTVSEAGLPGFDVTSWYGVFGPAALPKDIVAKLNADVAAILGAADLKERLATLGAEPAPMSQEDFGRFVREEIAKWAKVVKASGAKVD